LNKKKENTPWRLILESCQDVVQKQEAISIIPVSKLQCPMENAIGMVGQCQ
jgi:hypothetical protein